MKRDITLEEISGFPWQILPQTLQTLASVAAGHETDSPEVEARLGNQVREPFLTRGNVGVIPIHGVMRPKTSFGASTVQLGQWFDQLVKDPNISAIVFDIDSPGGAAIGNQELANRIMDARGSKPIVAVANMMMCSAAYYVGSAADEVVVSPSSITGSIGTIMLHASFERLLKSVGIEVTVLHAGKHKADGWPFNDLNEQSRATMMEEVNTMNDHFLGAVARQRGVSRETVEETFGQGKVFWPANAVRIGMADRVGTLESVLQQLADRSSNRKRTSQMSDQRPPKPAENAIWNEEAKSWYLPAGSQDVVRVQGISGEPLKTAADHDADKDLAAKDQTIADLQAKLQQQETANEIRALCESVGKPEMADAFCTAGLSLDQAREKLLAGFASEHKLSNAAGERDLAQQTDPDAKFGKEYDDCAEDMQFMGISREQYIQSRKLDESGGAVPLNAFERKPAEAK